MVLKVGNQCASLLKTFKLHYKLQLFIPIACWKLSSGFNQFKSIKRKKLKLWLSTWNSLQ